MKKIVIYILSILTIISMVKADMNDSDKSKTIECTGIYYANSMIPQGELELDKIVHSFAAKKFLNSYLVKEGINEEKLNKDVMENHMTKIPQKIVIILSLN